MTLFIKKATNVRNGYSQKSEDETQMCKHEILMRHPRNLSYLYHAISSKRIVSFHIIFLYSFGAYLVRFNVILRDTLSKNLISSQKWHFTLLTLSPFKFFLTSIV